MPTKSDVDVLDVAVVGGGIAGVYCAWRLIHDRPPPGDEKARFLGEAWERKRGSKPRVALFEMSQRIGGRLLSVKPPRMPQTRCDLGGMRYSSTQVHVRSLVEKKLGLRTYPFHVTEANNLAYLRGRHLRSRDLTHPDKVPYNLDPLEKCQHPDTLFLYGIEQVLPEVARAAPDLAAMRTALNHARVEGRPIADWGFWNLLTRGLSREAYTFALQASGYNVIGLNYNAADTILLNLADFGPDVQYHRLAEGFEKLPATLYDQFVRAGGQAHLGRRLLSFAADGQHPLRLKFTRGGKEVEVRARALILAMPRRSLELLQESDPDLGTKLGKQFQEDVGSVSPVPLFKMFLCYPFPWWQSLKVSEGQSVTDLPLRQCYYWAVESEQEGGDPRNHHAVLLATYDDTLNVSFWEGYREPESRRLLMSQGKWEDHKAPAAMLQEVQRQLQEMHGLRYIPEPSSAAYQDWSEDPYGGGVNFWNIHARSWEIIPRMIQPNPDVPVYICGEAYSGHQGWVEGALETAEQVLRDHFGLPPPDWLSS